MNNKWSAWFRLKDNDKQRLFFMDNTRFQVVPCGRRSGKTEIGRRKIMLKAFNSYKKNFFMSAPTREQCKRIFWESSKALAKPLAPNRRNFSESELVITLLNGSRIYLIGLDKPERIEGIPWSGGIVDEFGNTKPNAWKNHIRPALSDTNGFCYFTGVPEGKNHYYDLNNKSLSDDTGQWSNHHWFSSEILPVWEIEQAKSDLDELTFRQEYQAEFLSFEGLCYYKFSNENIIKENPYNHELPLIFCFDFNVSPGIAIILQEHDIGTVVIDEIYISKNSNTEKVCNQLIGRWQSRYPSSHIYLYGDASGGNRSTSGLVGTDWDIIKQMIIAGFPCCKVISKVPSSNPPVRARINSLNSRIKSMSGEVKFFVCNHCRHTIEDFEKTESDELGNPKKTSNTQYTHITDAIGYYINQKFPSHGKIAIA